MSFRSRLPEGTDQALADLCGCSRIWFRKVVIDGATPSPALAKRIAEVSGGSIHWTEFFEKHDNHRSEGIQHRSEEVA